MQAFLVRLLIHSLRLVVQKRIELSGCNYATCTGLNNVRGLGIGVRLEDAHYPALTHGSFI